MIKLLSLLASIGLTTSSVSVAAGLVQNVNAKTKTLSIQEKNKLKIEDQFNNIYKITVSNKIIDNVTQAVWEGSFDVTLKLESPLYAVMSAKLTFSNFQGDLIPSLVLGDWISIEGDTILDITHEIPTPTSEIFFPRQGSEMSFTWARPRTSWIKGVGLLAITWSAPDGGVSVTENPMAIVEPFPWNLKGKVYPVLMDLTGRLVSPRIEGRWTKVDNPLPWTEKEQNEAKQWFNENVEGTIDWSQITMYHIRDLEYGGSNDPYDNIMLLPTAGGYTDKLDDWWGTYY